MIKATSINTSAVEESNGEPVVTIQIDGTALMLIYKSLMFSGLMMSDLHDKVCNGDEESPVLASIHGALDAMEEAIEAFTEIIDAVDEASPECPGCGEHHFHQADPSELPTTMSDEALANVVELFTKQFEESGNEE